MSLCRTLEVSSGLQQLTSGGGPARRAGQQWRGHPRDLAVVEHLDVAAEPDEAVQQLRQDHVELVAQLAAEEVADHEHFASEMGGGGRERGGHAKRCAGICVGFGRDRKSTRLNYSP